MCLVRNSHNEKKNLFTIPKNMKINYIQLKKKDEKIQDSIETTKKN